jgi:hypothetical protein
MTENRIERALEDDYLSRDPSTSKRAAYIRRTMEKARRWAERFVVRPIAALVAASQNKPMLALRDGHPISECT